MSITAIRPSAAEVARAAVAAAREAIARAAQEPLGAFSDAELGELVADTAALESQTAALRLAASHEADRRRVADETGDTGTDAWLARLTGDKREQLKGGLLLARRLQETYHHTREALAAGRIRLEQARVIVNGLQVSADEAGPDRLARAEELLVGKATGEATRSGVPMSPKQLRLAARRVYAGIDGDLAERHLDLSLRRAEATGAAETYLVMGDRGDGTFVGRFCLPERHGHLLRAALENLTAPRRLGRDRAGQTVTDDAAGSPNYYEVMGQGLCELIEHLPLDRLPRSAFTLLVTMPLADLQAGLGAATISTGTDVSAGDVRRLACEAGIVPAVLGGDSVPLDLGRTRREFTDKHRQALALRHTTCAIAGCERPFAWTEIHHIIPWWAGGYTDLDNALPLCAHHHHKAHDRRFELTQHDELEWSLIRRR